MVKVPDGKKLNLTWSFLISLAAYIFLSYFVNRAETELVIGIYILLFISYYRFYSLTDSGNFETLFNFGLVFRVALLTSIPNLSDDFYRFIWDGRLINAGVDPFAHLPSFYADSLETIPGLTQHLYDNLNSPEYFTIYPPVNQFIFWVSTFISPNSIQWSIIIMKLFVIGADIGNMYLMKKLGSIFEIKSKALILYILNPLVILEFSGNLHFEAILICFVLLAIYFIKKQKLNLGAWALGMGVLTKLIPLMVLPLFLRRLKIRKWWMFYGITGATIVVLTIPILTEGLISGMTESIGLYFQRFEFNASVYYAMRYLGYQLTGYNQIQVIGKILAVVTFTSIMAFSLSPKGKKLELPEAFMWIFLIYFSFANIVHPWYTTTLLALSVFTKYRFPVVWTFMIFFTYVGYHANGYNENLWIVGIEYVILFLVVGVEIFSRRKEEIKKAL